MLAGCNKCLAGQILPGASEIEIKASSAQSNFTYYIHMAELSELEKFPFSLAHITDRQTDRHAWRSIKGMGTAARYIHVLKSLRRRKKERNRMKDILERKCDVSPDFSFAPFFPTRRLDITRSKQQVAETGGTTTLTRHTQQGSTNPAMKSIRASLGNLFLGGENIVPTYIRSNTCKGMYVYMYEYVCVDGREVKCCCCWMIGGRLGRFGSRFSLDRW